MRIQHQWWFTGQGLYRSTAFFWVIRYEILESLESRLRQTWNLCWRAQYSPEFLKNNRKTLQVLDKRKNICLCWEGKVKARKRWKLVHVCHLCEGKTWCFKKMVHYWNNDWLWYQKLVGDERFCHYIPQFSRYQITSFFLCLLPFFLLSFSSIPRDPIRFAVSQEILGESNWPGFVAIF